MLRAIAKAAAHLYRTIATGVRANLYRYLGAVFDFTQLNFEFGPSWRYRYASWPVS